MQRQLEQPWRPDEGCWFLTRLLRVFYLFQTVADPRHYERLILRLLGYHPQMELVIDTFPGAIFQPSLVISVYGLPRRQVVRHHSPILATLENIEYPVDHFP